MPQVIPIHWYENAERSRCLGQLVLGDDAQICAMAFRYQDDWVKDGFALGSDLPLKPTVLYPVNDLMETDPVLSARNGKFGFFADHAPGKWVERLLRQAHLNGFKFDSFDSSPTASQIWTGSGHVLTRFSALALPLTHGFRTEFIPPLVDIEAGGKSSKSLRNLSAAMEAMQSSATFKTKEPLELLLSSATELGGTIPKCVVRLDKTNTQWVVRHASAREPSNWALWMAVTRKLAQECGLKVVEGKLIAPRLYAERRFDRNEDGSPLLCLSAATLVRREKTRERILNPSPMSYLDIADILNRSGAKPAEDLRELFRRLLFNTLTGNNRDRLDQFWFTHSGLGWNLLPLYAPCAQQPILSARFLSTPIRPGINMSDADTAVTVSRYFGVSAKEAKAMRLEFMHILTQWRSIAESFGADLLEIRQMQGAFE